MATKVRGNLTSSVDHVIPAFSTVPRTSHACEIPLVADDMTQHRTYNSSHVTLTAREFRENMLHHELLHVRLHVWVTHDKGPQRRCHIESAEFLRRRGIPIRVG